MGKRRKRQRIDARLNPEVLEMLDAVGEECAMTRTKLIELGACLVCDIAMDVREAGGR